MHIFLYIPSYLQACTHKHTHTHTHTHSYTCTYIYIYILTILHTSLQAVLFRAGELLGIARCDEGLHAVGLTVTAVQSLLQEAGRHFTCFIGTKVRTLTQQALQRPRCIS